MNEIEKYKDINPIINKTRKKQKKEKKLNGQLAAVITHEESTKHIHTENKSMKRP